MKTSATSTFHNLLAMNLKNIVSDRNSFYCCGFTGDTNNNTEYWTFILKQIFGI